MALTIGDHVRGADLEVVAGEAGLDRAVTGVRLLDRSGYDAGEPGALLVLAWEPARRGAPLPPLRPLIARTAGAAPAGLVVLTRDRTVRPPADAVDAADELDLPLLWAGRDVEPPAVLDQLRRVAAAGPRPVDGLAAVLQGEAGLQPLVERLATALHATVRVTGPGGNPLAEHAAVPDSDADADREDEVLAPLVHRSRQLGVLAVRRARPFTRADHVIIDALGPVLVLALRVAAAEDQDAAPVRECLAAILGDDLAARESAVRRSKRLALFPARPALFVVVVPFGVTLPRPGLARLARMMEAPVEALDGSALVAVHEGAVVLLVGAEVDLERLVRGLHRRAPVALSVGSSRPVADVRSFAGAFRQAQRAATIGRRIGTANRLNRYDELGVYRLLYQLPEHERRAFVQEVLGAVAGEAKEAVESRRVLRSFRQTNGNIAEAARMLFLHHNTFRQRLSRLTAEVGDVVSDADVRLAVFVALDLHRLDNHLEG